MKLTQNFLLILLIVLLPVVKTNAQQKVGLNIFSEKAYGDEKIESYRVKLQDSTKVNSFTEFDYYLSGKLKSETHFAKTFNEKTHKEKIIKEGIFKMWCENGMLKRELNFHNDSIDGNLVTYWDNNQVKRRETYKSDKQIEGKCFDINGKEVKYYPFVEYPEYPGGNNEMLQIIYRNLRYPPIDQENQIQGKVVVSFYVDSIGNLVNLKIVKSLSKTLDFECFRVISLFKRMKPGKVDGEFQYINMTLPIMFKLQ